MKRLIKRYVLKAQVDRENDEVNEGKKSNPLLYPLCTFYDMYCMCVCVCEEGEKRPLLLVSVFALQCSVQQK